MKREVITTADGSKTIYLPGMNEQYHSLKGALAESEFVFIGNGYLHHPAKSPLVLEVGFGTGLNCLLTALQAEKLNRKTIYFALDNFPLNQSLIDELGYEKLFGSTNAENIFHKIHDSDWGIMQQITASFQLMKIKTDITTTSLKNVDPCNITYFDAFGPDKQPEMWTPEIFGKIFESTLPGGIFVTYSAKGEVRRQLTNTGFKVERLPGPPGKKEMLRARKTDSII